MNHICAEITSITPELVIEHNQSDLSEGQWVVLVVTKSENIMMDDTDTVAVKQLPSSYHVSTEIGYWQEGKWHELSGKALWHSVGIFPQFKISDELLDLEETQRQLDEYSNRPSVVEGLNLED